MAAEALKLTAKDMKKAKLIDKIITEPIGGAHFDRSTIFKSVKDEVYKSFINLDKLNSKDLIKLRREKFNSMGIFDS